MNMIGYKNLWFVDFRFFFCKFHMECHIYIIYNSIIRFLKPLGITSMNRNKIMILCRGKELMKLLNKSYNTYIYNTIFDNVVFQTSLYISNKCYILNAYLKWNIESKDQLFCYRKSSLYTFLSSHLHTKNENRNKIN